MIGQYWQIISASQYIGRAQQTKMFKVTFEMLQSENLCLKRPRIINGLSEWLLMKFLSICLIDQSANSSATIIQVTVRGVVSW